MKKLLALLGISIFSGSLVEISLDASNILQKTKLRSSEIPGGFVVKKWTTSLPPCAFGQKLRLEGEPSLISRIFEWADDNQRLIESARANALAVAGESVEGLEPVSYLVSFRREGYRVEFEFAHLLPPRYESFAAGRDCNIANMQPIPEKRRFLSCEALESALRSEIARVTATNSEERYWWEYDYAINFQSLELDFTPTFCVPNGGIS